MRAFPWMIAFAATAFSLSAPAQACSPQPGYRVPTSLELAERAEVIVLGVVEREEREEGGSGSFGERVIVRPTHLLKGQALPGEVSLRGYFSNERMQARSSNPRELAAPNRDALSGACQRYVFDRGMMLLLFLERHGDRLLPISDPFSRAAEDVPSPDALWVRAVRIYAEITSLPAGQRRRALARRRDELRGRLNDSDAQAIAADIDRLLGEPARQSTKKVIPLRP